MSHLINEGLIYGITFDLNLWFIGQLRHWILILKGKMGIFVDGLFKSHIEVNHIVFQDVWNRSRVRNNAFNQIFIIFQWNITDKRGQGCFQQLNDLFWGIFMIRDHDELPLPIFSTSLNQIKWCSISNSYWVNSTIFSLLFYKIEYSLSIRYASVSQQENMLWITLINLFSKNLIKRIIYLCSSEVSTHGFNGLDGFVKGTSGVALTIREHFLASWTETYYVEVTVCR